MFARVELAIARGESGEVAYSERAMKLLRALERSQSNEVNRRHTAAVRWSAILRSRFERTGMLRTPARLRAVKWILFQ